MPNDTNLRAAHIQIGDHVFKIVWQVSASPNMEPKVVECSLALGDRGRSWDFEVKGIAKQFDELGQSMKRSIREGSNAN